MKLRLHMWESSSASLSKRHHPLHQRKFFCISTSFLNSSLSDKGSFCRVFTCITPRKAVPKSEWAVLPCAYQSSLSRLFRLVWMRENQGYRERWKSRKRMAWRPPRKGLRASLPQWQSSKVTSCSLFQSSHSSSTMRVILRLPPFSTICISSSFLWALDDLSPNQRKEWNLLRKQTCFGESLASALEWNMISTDNFFTFEAVAASSRKTFSRPKVGGWITEVAPSMLLILPLTQAAPFELGCSWKRQGILQNCLRKRSRMAAALRSWLAVATSCLFLQVNSAMVLRAWPICNSLMKLAIQTIFCTPSFLFFWLWMSLDFTISAISPSSFWKNLPLIISFFIASNFVRSVFFSSTTFSSCSLGALMSFSTSMAGGGCTLRATAAGRGTCSAGSSPLQWARTSSLQVPLYQFLRVSSSRLMRVGSLSLLLVPTAVGQLALLSLLCQKRKSWTTAQSSKVQSLLGSRRTQDSPASCRMLPPTSCKKMANSLLWLNLNLRACLKKDSGMRLRLVAGSVSLVLQIIFKVSLLMRGRWCRRRQASTQSVSGSSRMRQQAWQSLFLSARLICSAFWISWVARRGWWRLWPSSRSISFSLRVFWMSLEMMMAQPTTSGSLGEMQTLLAASPDSRSRRWCAASQISSSCVSILVMDSRFILGSNSRRHWCGSLPSRTPTTKKRSICSHMPTTSLCTRSLSSSRETSLIISRLRFHRKSKMCRNSTRCSPGGRGKARSFGRTLSASMISFWMCCMLRCSPLRDRGRSLPSSFSSSSSDRFVDRLYRFSARAQSGSLVRRLISKIAKERPVSRRSEAPSRLFIVKVSSRQLNSSSLHFRSILCSAIDLLEDPPCPADSPIPADSPTSADSPISASSSPEAGAAWELEEEGEEGYRQPEADCEADSYWDCSFQEFYEFSSSSLDASSAQISLPSYSEDFCLGEGGGGGTLPPVKGLGGGGTNVPRPLPPVNVLVSPSSLSYLWGLPLAFQLESLLGSPLPPRLFLPGKSWRPLGCPCYPPLLLSLGTNLSSS